MSDLEVRIQRIEDREALHDVLLAYYTAVDSLSDLDGLVECFTEEALFDVSPLGIGQFVGRPAIRGFFAQVFADMSHHAHHVTNIRIWSQDDKAATGRAYVVGRGRSHAGMQVFVSCYIDLEYARTGSGWKISSFVEGSLMPLEGEVAELHGQH